MIRYRVIVPYFQNHRRFRVSIFVEVEGRGYPRLEQVIQNCTDHMALETLNKWTQEDVNENTVPQRHDEGFNIPFF